MKKKLIYKILILSILLMNMSSAVADSVVTKDGTVINGNIKTVLSGYIEIDTKDGLKKLSREVTVGKVRDVIEVGFFKKKRYIGEVVYLTEDKIEFKTTHSRQELSRFWVRNVILSPHEISGL